MRDSRERIAIKPGDFVVMQFTPKEGVAQYITTKLQINLFGILADQKDFQSTATSTLP